MRIAIYAGTFDPVTYGHLSVVEAAAEAFDRLVVLIAKHPTKIPLFTESERLAFLTDCTSHLDNVVCDAFDGLVVQYAQKIGAKFMLRGVRDATDAEYESHLANLNRSLAPEITTFFLPADPALACVSSSRLKSMASFGEDGSSYCSPEIWRQLRQRLFSNHQVCGEDVLHGL